jgi:hypothetical protein
MQQELIAGDSLNFATATPAYPASAGWVLSYYLVPRTAGGQAITLSSVAEGDDHRIQVSAATTATWGADNYNWAARVDKSGEKYTVDQGQITIKPNPFAVPVGYDGRTQAEKALDQAKAALAAWTPSQRKYRIGEREMEFNSPADIIQAVNYWENQVAREQRAAAISKGLADKRKTYVRLGRV